MGHRRLRTAVSPSLLRANSRGLLPIMEDPYELAAATLGSALGAALLVAGLLYLAAGPVKSPDDSAASRPEISLR
jgi:hypothetical protein